MRLISSLVLILTVFAVLPAQAQDAQALSQRLERLERDIQTLSKMVVRGPEAVSSKELSTAAGADVPKLPANAVARIGVRLDSLENELRDVTGRIEELTYGLEQLTARVDRLVADVDFRLSGLEGQGRPAAQGQSLQGTAAAQSVEGVPQANAAPTPPGVRIIGEPPKTLGQIDPNLVKSGNAPVEQAGGGAPAASATGAAVETQAVQPPANAPVSNEVPRAQPQTASLPQASSPPEPILPDGTPQEQYQFAFGLLRKHQFDQAEMAFKEFLSKHEGNALTGNARYWLGETHYARAEYVKAAEVFLQGFEKNPKGGKAPDSLLKLAMSLGQLGQNKEGCAAIDKLFVDFPNANSSLKRTAARQQRQMNCKQ